jgi:hypothetical protein
MFREWEAQEHTQRFMTYINKIGRRHELLQKMMESSIVKATSINAYYMKEKEEKGLVHYKDIGFNVEGCHASINILDGEKMTSTQHRTIFHKYYFQRCEVVENTYQFQSFLYCIFLFLSQQTCPL